MMGKRKIREDQYSRQLKVGEGPEADLERVIGFVLDLVNAPAYAVKEALETFEEQLKGMSNVRAKSTVRVRLETIIGILKLILEKRDLL
jgi:hypothetical protein